VVRIASLDLMTSLTVRPSSRFRSAWVPLRMEVAEPRNE
jgi:hypothetical protein